MKPTAHIGRIPLYPAAYDLDDLKRLIRVARVLLRDASTLEALAAATELVSLLEKLVNNRPETA